MFMDATKKITALFDCDGVIVDTEGQYTVFWNEMGQKYVNDANFGSKVKGQTLVQIYDKYFAGESEKQRDITEALNRFEIKMNYDYVPGIVEFIADLRRHGVKIALVTSSNTAKMENVYHAHPEFKSLFDEILTAERFKRSKPDPECFLLGITILGSDSKDSYVFEDSFHGLQAGRSSGAIVVGLATTNSREAIADKADYVIDDFRGMTYEKLLTITSRYI